MTVVNLPKKGTCTRQVPFLFSGNIIKGDFMLNKVNFREYFTVFGFGAVIYSLVEVVTRGYTHWTMTITGGVAFLLIYLINVNMKTNSLILRCLVGCLVITAIEFSVGMLVNRGLHWNVCDYSDEKFNLFGQICPLFSFLWFLICIPGTILSFILKGQLRKS